MILKIYLKDDFRIGTPYLKPENSPGPLTEYSTGTLVVLLDYLASSLYFTWVNPTNRKFEERALYRAAELDETGRYAYKATIFPIMTVGLARQDSAFSMVCFREGGKLSPYIKIPVVRSIYPEQTEIPPTAVDEINAEINDIKQDIHEITAGQPITKVEHPPFDEAGLITFMKSAENGIYKIKTQLWGDELLFVSDMLLPDKEVVWGEDEEPTLVLYKEYARYTSNGSSFRYNEDTEEWEMSAGGGGSGEEPENKEVLDKLTEQNGKLLYNGQEIKPTPVQVIDEQSTHEDIPSAKAVEDRITNLSYNNTIIVPESTDDNTINSILQQKKDGVYEVYEEDSSEEMEFVDKVDVTSTHKQIPSAKAVNDLVLETALNIINLPHSNEYDLFVFSGQSNMQGFGSLSVLDRTENFYGLEYLKSSNSFVNCKHSSGENLNGIDPLTGTSFQCFDKASKGNGNYILNGQLVDDSPIPVGERGGPSIPPYFAKAYNKYGKKSINMHIAYKGTSICEWLKLEDTERINAMEQFKPIFEKPNGFNYDNLTSEDPDKKALAERMYRGHVRHAVMIDKINSCLTKFAQEFPTSTIKNKVFVWHQGERDSDQCVLSDTQENITLSKELYKERFLALWNSLKTECGFNYALIVRVGFWGNAISDQIIMAAQEELALEHEDIFIATRIASFFPHWNVDTGQVKGYFANKPIYPDCIGTRDTYYGVNNGHIGEKGFRLMAEKTAESAYRILHLKQPPLLEPEQTDAFDYVEIKTLLESFTMSLSSNQIAKGSTITVSFVPTPAVFKGSIQLTVEPSVGVTIQNNKITFANAGNYTVTATYSENDAIRQTALVEVIDPTIPVTGVVLNKTTLVLNVGETDTLIATIIPANASNKIVYWTSSAPTIATVTNGLVTGVAEGVATITVTTQDGGFTQSCNVTVNVAPVQDDILFLDLRTPLDDPLNESVGGAFASNGDAVYDAEKKAYLLNPVKTLEEQTIETSGFSLPVSVDIIPASGQSRDITIAFGGYRAAETFIFRNNLRTSLYGTHTWLGGLGNNFVLRAYASDSSDVERTVRITNIFNPNDVAHRIYLITLTLSETDPCNIVITEYSQDLTTGVLTEVRVRDTSPKSNAANNQAIIKDLKLHSFFSKWGLSTMQPNDAFATFLRVKEGTRTLQEMAPWLYE